MAPPQKNPPGFGPPEDVTGFDPPEDSAVASTPPPAPPPSLLSRAWSLINTPVGEHFKTYNDENQKLEDLQNGPQTKAQAAEMAAHPIATAAKGYLAGVEQRAAGLATPLTAALALIPGMEGFAKGAAIPGAATTAKVVNAAIPTAFAGMGAQQLSQAAADQFRKPEDRQLDDDTRIRLALGGGAALAGVGAGASPLARKLAGKFAETVTSTSPRATEELVQSTQKANDKKSTRTDTINQTRAAIDAERIRKVNEANELARQTAADKTAKQQKDYQAKLDKNAQDAADALKEHQDKVKATQQGNVKSLQDHIAKVDEISKDNQAGKAAIDAREGLQNSIKDATDELDVRTEKARHDALAEGNRKYSAVNPELNPIGADPEFMENALQDSSEAIKGSNTKVPVLEDISKRMQKGDEFNYEDLQGYYSELGREISKGTLPGDVFHALDTLHESIGQEMQRIADSQGKGAELSAAREYWRRMKQTFGQSSDAISDRAGKEVTEANKGFIGDQLRAYRQRLLGSFDPKIPELIGHIEKGKGSLDALPSEEKARGLVKDFPDPPAPMPLPKAPVAVPNPPAPEPVVAREKSVPQPRPALQFQPKTIGTEDAEANLRTGLAKTANDIRKSGVRRAMYVAGASIPAEILTAMMGHPALGGVEAVAAPGAVIGFSHAIAGLLEKPSVIKWLTTIDERHIAAIPPEMRGEIKPLVEAATKKGIKVSPSLIALVGAAGVTPKHPTLSKQSPVQ